MSDLVGGLAGLSLLIGLSQCCSNACLLKYKCIFFSISVCYALSMSLGKTVHIHCTNGAPRGFGDLRRMAIYFQGAGEHLQGFWEQAHNFCDL